MIFLTKKKCQAMIAQLCLIAKSITGIVKVSDLSNETLQHDFVAIHILFDLASEIGGIDGLIAVKNYTISGQKTDHGTQIEVHS